MTRVHNAADESQVTNAKKRELRGEELSLDDLRRILETDYGRRFVWGLLGKCGVFELSFNNSGSITAFNEGQRNVGLKYFSDVMKQFPDLYLRMAQEAKQRERE